MKSITYTAARENLASTINRVCEDHAPVVITKNRDQSVVMLSLKEYESLQETAYLLRSPVNAKRLIDAMEALTGLGRLSLLATKRTGSDLADQSVDQRYHAQSSRGHWQT